MDILLSNRIVIGPPRSGTWCHIDPLATSAWNALIFGRKRWALFPPRTDKHLVDPKLKNEEGIDWFAHVYPRALKSDWNAPKPLNVIQVTSHDILMD